MPWVALTRFLDHPTPEAAILAILGDPGDLPLERVVRRAVARLGELSGQRRERMIAALEIVAHLRKNLLPILKQELAMTLAIRLEDLPAYQLGEERGLERGLVSGEQKALLELLRARFASLPDWVEQQVQALADEESIATLIRTAATAQSLEEVFAAGDGG